MEIIFEADRQALERLLGKREQQKEEIDNQIEPCDKRIIRRAVGKSIKRYNLTQTAGILGVHRRTLYYWMKKGWVKPKRDNRNCPVFTVLDIENLIKWKNTIKI